MQNERHVVNISLEAPQRHRQPTAEEFVRQYLGGTELTALVETSALLGGSLRLSVQNLEIAQRIQQYFTDEHQLRRSYIEPAEAA